MTSRSFPRLLLALVLSGLACAAWGQAPPAGVWLIRGARVVPVEGAVLERADILVRGGVIEAVGPGLTAPAGAQELNAGGLSVYPGLIDLHSTLAQPFVPASGGGRGRGGQGMPAPMPAPMPAVEGPAPVNPPAPDLSTLEAQLSAVSLGLAPAWQVAAALKASDRDFSAARSAGVTLALSAPRTGAIPGQAALVRPLPGEAAAFVEEKAGPVCFAFSGGAGRYPGTLMAVLAAQRQMLADAQRHAALSAAAEKSPDLDALRPVIRGEQWVHFTANREREIDRALKLADEFRFRLAVAGGAEANRLAPELARRGTPVLFALGTSTSGTGASVPAELLRAGVPLALTSRGLSGYDDLPGAVRRFMAGGLTEEQAVRALTLSPAEILGVSGRYGSIRPGKAADLIVSEGPLFASGSRLRHVFVKGQPFELKQEPRTESNRPGSEPAANDGAIVPAPASEVVLVKNATLLTVTRGVIPNGSILIRSGRIAAIGPSASVPAPQGAQVIDATGKYVMPGIVDAHSHMAIEGGINEGSYSVTPEVRIGDCINPRDITVYRALAGGVTTAHVMHGSANTIGGQNAIIKLKWGEPADDLLVPGAPRTVKFALGENPKRSNSTLQPGAARRYPATRLGVENVLRASFTAARAYRDRWDAYHAARGRGESPQPPRRDLRLEALADILTGKILVQAHCYRSDEILMLLRIADEFGFKIRTLHHALEAYKVAPEIARHGAGVSTFSDHWAYKVEAYDAIPHNAALTTRAGVRVSINSDSNERVRRMYWEAAKCMKYGDMTETEALKTITLHPAWQIGIDHRVGSLEVGKDADLAIFSAHPFAANTRCEMTLVEGRIFFDRKQDLERRGKPGYPAPEAEQALSIGSDDDCECDLELYLESEQ
ncbi:MAG: amidohydrolase family protein [Armatimonadota bacterium]